MKLIDKDTVVEEIKKKLQDLISCKKDALYPEERVISRAGIDMCKEILSFLNAIETREVDLEKEIKNKIDSLCNLYCYMEDLFNGKEEEGVYPVPQKVTNELFNFAKYFFELGLKSQKGE